MVHYKLGLIFTLLAMIPITYDYTAALHVFAEILENGRQRQEHLQKERRRVKLGNFR